MTTSEQSMGTRTTGNMTASRSNVFVSPNYVQRGDDEKQDRGVFDLFPRDERHFDELHQVAAKIGLTRDQFSVEDAYPYRYVVDSRLRNKAIAVGAKGTTDIQMKVFRHYWWEMHLRNRF